MDVTYSKTQCKFILGPGRQIKNILPAGIYMFKVNTKDTRTTLFVFSLSHVTSAEAYSEPFQISKIKSFAKIVNGF